MSGLLGFCSRILWNFEFELLFFKLKRTFMLVCRLTNLVWGSALVVAGVSLKDHVRLSNSLVLAVLIVNDALAD